MVSMHYVERFRMSGTSQAVRNTLLLTHSPSHRVSALLQSRRWKRAHTAPAGQAALNVDLDNILKNNIGVKLHNPLLKLEAKEKQLEIDRKEMEAENVRKDLDGRGVLFPLSPVEQYGIERKRFLSLHNGVDRTPTRVFYGMHDPGSTINPKLAFGDVRVFKKAIPKPKRKRLARDIFQNEFNFAKPQVDKAYYLGHLALYVYALHILWRADLRLVNEYLGDFFLIIKAIRQRPSIHASLVGMHEFKGYVLQYLLVAKQEKLALTLAINVFPNVLSEMLRRWVVAGVLKLGPLQKQDLNGFRQLMIYRESLNQSTQERIARLSRVKKRRANLIPDADALKEINIERLSTTIIQYYQGLRKSKPTSWEIIQLISMAKTRLGARGLMSLIPIVLRYFYEYGGRSNSVDNAVDFYYDRWVCELSVGGFEIVLHYIMAFIGLGDYEKACSVVVTIENMPPKPIKGLEGNSRDIAGVLKYIMSADIDPTICDVFFDGFGKIEIGNAAGPTVEKPKYAVLRLKLADLIVKFATARVDKDSDAATSVLSAMSHRLQSLTTMAIVRQLNRISARNAAGWITRNFYKFDMEAQKAAFAWLTTNLLEDKNACSQFISYYSFSDLNTVSRLVHLVLRHPLDEKTDKRYILDLALQHIPRNGNAKAIGSLLIAMAKGPVSSHLSSFNLQSLTSCGWMTAGLLSSITQIKDLDISTLIPYMFKAAQLLNSSNLEQILWKEVLRHGIDVGQSILKPSLAMRFGRGNPNETTLELVRHALCLSTEPEEIHETEQLAAEDNASDNHLSSNNLAALYMVILNGANHAGASDAVELLANFMLDNSDLSDRSFGSLASIWLDSAGFSKQSSNDNVQRVWNIIKSYTGPEIAAKRMREEYHINRNHYHSVIEALIRQGDVEGAWFMICFEMRKALIKPDLKTFYTIISPLASSSQLWSLGKDMVQRFNRQHPEIVKEALNDRSNRPILQALLRMSLKSTSGTNMSTLHPLSKLGTRPL